MLKTTIFWLSLLLLVANAAGQNMTTPATPVIVINPPSFPPGTPTTTSYDPPVTPSPPDDYRTMVEPRFCNLDINTTCYCCDWDDYASNLSMRSLGAIIGCGVSWIVLMILVCCFCWSTSLKDRTHLGEDAPGADCHVIAKTFLMLIPVLMLIAGILFMLIAHENLNPTFQSSSDELEATRQEVIDMENSINSYLSEVPAGVTIDVTKLQSGLNDMQSNVKFFITQVNSVNIGRNVVVWFSAVLAVFTGVFCCVYIHCNNGCLFEIFCSVVILLILGCCVCIPVMDVIQNMSNDCCNEFYYKVGLLELWQSTLARNIKDLDTTTILPTLNNNANKGCDYIFQLCNVGGCCTEMCADCTANNITNFANYTLNDNGNIRSLNSCAIVCTNNSLLRNLSINAMQQIEYVQYWTGFRNTLYETLVPLENGKLRSDLKGWVCNIGYNVGAVYAGCGLLIGGAVVATVLCLLLRGNEKKNMDKK